MTTDHTPRLRFDGLDHGARLRLDAAAFKALEGLDARRSSSTIARLFAAAQLGPTLSADTHPRAVLLQQIANASHAAAGSIEAAKSGGAGGLPLAQCPHFRLYMHLRAQLVEGTQLAAMVRDAEARLFASWASYVTASCLLNDTVCAGSHTAREAMRALDHGAASPRASTLLAVSSTRHSESVAASAALRAKAAALTALSRASQALSNAADTVAVYSGETIVLRTNPSPALVSDAFLAEPPEAQTALKSALAAESAQWLGAHSRSSSPGGSADGGGHWGGAGSATLAPSSPVLLAVLAPSEHGVEGSAGRCTNRATRVSLRGMRNAVAAAQGRISAAAAAVDVLCEGSLALSEGRAPPAVGSRPRSVMPAPPSPAGAADAAVARAREQSKASVAARRALRLEQAGIALEMGSSERRVLTAAVAGAMRAMGATIAQLHRVRDAERAASYPAGSSAAAASEAAAVSAERDALGTAAAAAALLDRSEGGSGARSSSPGGAAGSATDVELAAATELLRGGGLTELPPIALGWDADDSYAERVTLLSGHLGHLTRRLGELVTVLAAGKSVLLALPQRAPDATALSGGRGGLSSAVRSPGEEALWSARHRSPSPQKLGRPSPSRGVAAAPVVVLVRGASAASGKGPAAPRAAARPSSRSPPSSRGGALWQRVWTAASQSTAAPPVPMAVPPPSSGRTRVRPRPATSASASSGSAWDTRSPRSGAGSSPSSPASDSFMRQAAAASHRAPGVELFASLMAQGGGSASPRALPQPRGSVSPGEGSAPPLEGHAPLPKETLHPKPAAARKAPLLLDERPAWLSGGAEAPTPPPARKPRVPLPSFSERVSPKPAAARKQQVPQRTQQQVHQLKQPRRSMGTSPPKGATIASPRAAAPHASPRSRSGGSSSSAAEGGGRHTLRGWTPDAALAAAIADAEIAAVAAGLPGVLGSVSAQPLPSHSPQVSSSGRTPRAAASSPREAILAKLLSARLRSPPPLQATASDRDGSPAAGGKDASPPPAAKPRSGSLRLREPLPPASPPPVAQAPLQPPRTPASGSRASAVLPSPPPPASSRGAAPGGSDIASPPRLRSLATAATASPALPSAPHPRLPPLPSSPPLKGTRVVGPLPSSPPPK